ncbi:DUF2306 domain-containing protein [Fodinibius saliphilus]|uniref:DUF2306 domain-containing protein n=1 Tax=Fodinibius saliphilus TaxID=1920650 RepID=UPI001108E6DA|nr:DUF2306 domain-containing protein [Fodinibius saliphilus]
MNYLVQDWIGSIHLITAILSLITGTAILGLKKGTSLHIKIGYLYVGSMLGVNITAFMIYRLFGGFGIFHYAALISLLTVVLGFIPALLKKPKEGWLELHFSFMYWSVIGLYAAFVSEMLTRIPDTPFFGMLGIATFTIMALGGGYFYWKKNQWSETFLN